MTYCSNDFTNSTTPRETYTTNANGGIISSCMGWHRQTTTELNCAALMYSNFCPFLNILTKEIIKCGTKREGLYYMDDFNSSKINIVQHINGSRQKFFKLWHCHLGHPSYRYMKHLLPYLFSNGGQFGL
ncbi:hypothetical protein CR513_42502, partial [Mucuna pruriens]